MKRLSDLLMRFEVPKMSPEHKAELEAAEAAEREQARRRRYAQIGVPERFKSADINKCRPDARQYVRELLGGSRRGLVIRGNVGVGKTYTAAAILNAVFEKRFCRFTTFGSVMRGIRTAYDGRGSEDEVISRFTGADVLLVDDFGKERPSAWALEIIFDCLNARYAAKRPTIYTTQHNGSELAGRLSAEGDVAIAEAILSRLGDRSAFASIVLEGSDRRRMGR